MNPLTIRPDRLAKLRELCLALPDTSEKVAWGDPVWCVAGRIFAMQKGNAEGHRPSLWVKADDGVQEMAVAAAPERFFVPPYVGGYGWIGVWLDRPRLDWKEIAALLHDSARLIGEKRAAAKAKRAKRPRRR